MKPIRIKTVPGIFQRYPTCGDYQDQGDYISMTITEQGNEDHEFLIMVHELIEWYIARKRGISEEQITDYDLEWEKKDTAKADEPGNEEDCIYRHEHRFAENVERLLAHELGLDWNTYNNSLKI